MPELRPEPKPSEGYINLTDKETLYALRCVADTPPQDCQVHGAFIGISKRALMSLVADGLLRVEGEIVPCYRLTPGGRRVVDLAGRFRHG